MVNVDDEETTVVEKPVDNTSVIYQAVKDVYLADVESIGNLSTIAAALQTDDGMIIPGNTNFRGNLNVGSITDYDSYISIGMNGTGTEESPGTNYHIKKLRDTNDNHSFRVTSNVTGPNNTDELIELTELTDPIEPIEPITILNIDNDSYINIQGVSAINIQSNSANGSYLNAVNGSLDIFEDSLQINGYSLDESLLNINKGH